MIDTWFNHFQLVLCQLVYMSDHHGQCRRSLKRCRLVSRKDFHIYGWKLDSITECKWYKWYRWLGSRCVAQCSFIENGMAPISLKDAVTRIKRQAHDAPSKKCGASTSTNSRSTKQVKKLGSVRLGYVPDNFSWLIVSHPKKIKFKQHLFLTSSSA